MGVGGGEPLVGLVGNQVRSDHAETAGRCEIARPGVDPVVQHRVPVRHHHGTAAGGADGLHRTQGVTDLDSAVQRHIRRRRDHRAVHPRIGVRHADFDDVATGFDQRHHRLDRRRDIGIAGGQVADERGPSRAARAQRSPAGRAGCAERSHGPPWPCCPNSPNHLAAVSTSLSPRPERLTRMIAPRPSSAASFTAPATACADSIAGMMPSVGTAAGTRPSPRRR